MEYIKHFLFITAAILSIAACTEEINNIDPEAAVPEGTVSLTLCSDNSEFDTRTQYDAALNNIIWSPEEYADFYIDGTAYNKKAAKIAENSKGNTATFQIDGIIPNSSNQILIQGIYPAQSELLRSKNVLSPDKQSVTAFATDLKSHQSISQNSFDPAADILAAQNAIVELNGAASYQSTIKYGRITAITELTLTGLSAYNNEAIKYIKFELGPNVNRYIAGHVLFNPELNSFVKNDGITPVDDVHADMFISSKSKSIQMDYKKGEVITDGIIKGWMISSPIILEKGNQIFITVETEKHCWRKTVAVPQMTEFKNNMHNTLTIDMSQAEIREPGMTIKVNDKVSFDMVFVKGGIFEMGGTPEQLQFDDPDEMPAHEVQLNDFYIGKYEVTQGLWEAIMGSNPSNNLSGDNYPTEQVTWTAAQEFIGKLNEITGKKFRLPTEAQWEYAARGGIYTNHYIYSGSDNIDEVAWYEDNSGKVTHPIGLKKPNELGLYDMTGNVFEWCSDWYGKFDVNPTAAPLLNPVGPTSGEWRDLRGGSAQVYPRSCRVASRHYMHEFSKHKYFGLRLVYYEGEMESTHIALKDFRFWRSTLNIKVGDKGKNVNLQFTPKNASNVDVTYTLDNDCIEVDSWGYITPVKAGTTVITAVSAEGGITKTCTVNVTDPNTPIDPDPKPDPDPTPIPGGTYDSDITLSKTDRTGNVYDVNFVIDNKKYPGIKLGTGSNSGTCTFGLNGKTGDVELSMYALAWSGYKNTMTIKVNNGGVIDGVSENIALEYDTGFSGRSYTYTLTSVPTKHLLNFKIKEVTASSTITITNGSNSEDPRIGFLGVKIK